MAEFCLECFNKLNDTNLKESDVTLDDDLCEGCGEWKPCVMTIKRYSSYTDPYEYFAFGGYWRDLFGLLWALIEGVVKLIVFPIRWIYKRIRKK